MTEIERKRYMKEEYKQAGILPEALDTLMNNIEWLDANPKEWDSIRISS